MNKLSSEKVAAVLRDASSTIRKQASRIQSLEQELASRDLNERISKVASAMHSKGIRTDLDREELILDLEKQAQQGRLEVIEQSVDFVGPDMGKFAQLRNDDQQGVSSGSDFERYVGSVG